MRWISSLLSATLIASIGLIVSATSSSSLTNQTSPDQRVRYDGHRLYSIRPTTPEHLRTLTDLSNQEGYSFWGNVGGIRDKVNVMVSPSKLATFEELVEEQRMDVNELMDDVQRFIDQENPLSSVRGVFGWTAYHDLDEMNGWMDTLAVEHPELVTPLVGGETYEGRTIRGVKLSYREGNPGVFLEGGIHAREWISPAVVTYVLNELLTSTDPNVRSIAETYDWYVFPVYNPDGYVYTHKTNRLWRKTRQPYSARCVGADPNRNWDFHWKEKGASSFPCSETFAGGRAFSEIEARTMSEFITSVKEKIFAYIAFHSYSQVMLIPYGYSNSRIDNYADLMRIGNASATALAKRYGTRYRVGNIVDILYPASGGSMDWVRGTLNTPVTFTYELRDEGRYGFLLPANQIIPTGEETLDSLVALLKEAQLLGYGLPSGQHEYEIVHVL